MYKIIGADQKEYGPVTAEQLRQWVVEGRVNAQTLVQGEGQTSWQPLSSYPELATAVPPGGLPAAPITPVVMPAGGADAAQMVNGPATGLLIVGIISVLASVVGIISNLTGIGRSNQPMPPELERWVELMSGPMASVAGIIQIGLGIFAIVAAGKMKRLESYGLVMTATILSMLPCTSGCCCVGLPIGIWVLVVLSKPEVKSAFH